MTPLVIKYKLDPTGVSPNNLVQGEVHQMVRRKVRSIAPAQGAFFSASLRLIDTATNKTLVKGTQYIATEMIEEVTARFGKEVCSIILITDPAVSDEVSIQYQCVGDKWVNYAQTIQQLITALNLDDRPVSKDAIIDWPSEFPPAHHLHDVGDTYGWEFVVNALNRVLSSINMADAMKLDALYAYIDQTIGYVSPEVVSKITDEIAAAMAAHLADPDPHKQYLLKTEAESLMMPYVRKPIHVSPANGAVKTGVSLTLDASAFYSLYGIAQKGLSVRVSKNPGCVAPYVIEQYITTGDLTQYAAQGLEPSTTYYWQVQYRDVDNNVSPWSDPTSFDTGAVFVGQPTITSPVNGAEVVTNGFTMTASNFTAVGASDTHRATDWEIWTGPEATGTLVFSSYNNTSAKTSIQIPASTLANNTTFYPRVKYYGTTLGASTWSSARSFSVKYPPFPTVIGEAFGGGFYAGDISVPGAVYAIILAPRATGDTWGRLAEVDQGVYAGNEWDSLTNTNNLNAMAGGSNLAAWAKGLRIGGFSDWAIPALHVMQVIQSQFRVGSSTAPAAYQNNGSEAFNNELYWTSSPNNWVRDDSYCEDGAPIYGPVSREVSYEANYGPAGPMGESVQIEPTCDDGLTASGFSSSFSPSGNTTPDGEAIGYLSASWTCSGTVTTQEIIGYEEGQCYEIYTPVYDGYVVNMGSSSFTSTGKYGLWRCRAVRMIRKS